MTRSVAGFFAATTMLAVCLPLLAACGGAQIVAPSRADARTPIQLSAAEQERLRTGMRTYLESIHGIVEALAEHQNAAIAEKAKGSGMDMVHDVPLSVAITLPPEFAMLSADTHQKFDALALAAQKRATKTEVLGHLRDIVSNCTACHAMYRLAPG